MTIRFLGVLVVVVFFTAGASLAQTNSWRGLVPLHSTRQDVEAMFGPPVRDLIRTENADSTSGDAFEAIYIKKRCDGGWDVEPDTLEEFWVTSKASCGKSPTDLGLDQSKYFISADDAFYGTWTDPANGLGYHFNQGDRELMDIWYIPKRSDNDRRCDGFPPYRPEGHYYPYDKYGLYDPKRPRDSLFDVVARIQSFGMQIKESREKYRGYALVYYDRRLSFSAYSKRFQIIKNWVYNRLKIPRSDLTFIDGGLRAKSEIEPYLLPKDWPPPAPEPTLPSPQFMRKKSTGRKAASDKRTK